MSEMFDKRQAKNGLRKTHDLKQLRENHNAIIRLLICGVRPKQIAERLGCTPQTVINVKNSTLAKEKIAIMTGAKDAEAVDFNKEIEALVGPALKVYDKILNGDNAPLVLQKQTADTVLKDLSGKAAPKKVQATHLHAHITPDDCEEFKKRGMRAAAESGVMVIEADGTDG